METEYTIKLTCTDISVIHSWRDAYLDRYGADDEEDVPDTWAKISEQRNEQDNLAEKK